MVIVRPSLVFGCAAMCLGLAACPSTSSAPSEAATVSVTTVPSESAGPVASTPSASATPTSPDPIGSWTSPSCGDRKYVRIIALSKDHTFQASDRVSPCPPNVACVWSGIVERSGSWKLSGSTLTLEPSGEPQRAGVPLPTTLVFENNALSESSSGNNCVYNRG